jgi:predicted nucleotidyltransferase
MFGDRVASVLVRVLGDGLVSVYFVGSLALDGYLPDESNVDVAAASGPC